MQHQVPPTSQSPASQSSAIATATAPGSKYRWAVVGMLWFICLFNYADRQAISSVLPSLEEEFGFTKSQLGWIASSFMFVYALTAPLAGRIGDQVSRKMLIVGGLYVWSIVTGFTAGCSKLWQFVFVRGAEGLGETFYFPASMSLISDYHSPKTRSRAMSFHQTSVYAGTIAGGSFAGWMATNSDWRYAFVILGAGGVILGLVLAAFIREPRRNEAELAEQGKLAPEPAPAPVAPSGPPLPAWRRLLVDPLADVASFALELARVPSALLLVVAFFGANFVAFIFLTWMPTFLKEKHGLTLAAAGFSATFFLQIASMFGAIAGGFMADYWGVRRRGGRSLVQAFGAMCGVPLIYICGMTTELGVLIPAITVFGLAKGIYDSNIWASLYDVVPAEKRGTAVGLMNMIGWLGAGLGSNAVGMLVDRGISMSDVIASASLIYVGVVIALVASSLLTARRPA